LIFKFLLQQIAIQIDCTSTMYHAVHLQAANFIY